MIFSGVVLYLLSNILERYYIGKPQMAAILPTGSSECFTEEEA